MLGATISTVEVTQVLPNGLSELLTLLKEMDSHAHEGQLTEEQIQGRSFVKSLADELQVLASDTVIGNRIRILKQTQALPSAGVTPRPGFCFYYGKKL
jgi:hypothetical protein